MSSRNSSGYRRSTEGRSDEGHPRRPFGQAGYTMSGSFSNCLSKLRGLQLINGRKEISLAEELFE